MLRAAQRSMTVRGLFKQLLQLRPPSQKGEDEFSEDIYINNCYNELSLLLMAALRLMPVCLCLVLMAPGSGSASGW